MFICTTVVFMNIPRFGGSVVCAPSAPPGPQSNRETLEMTLQKGDQKWQAGGGGAWLG